MQYNCLISGKILLFVDFSMVFYKYNRLESQKINHFEAILIGSIQAFHSTINDLGCNGVGRHRLFSNSGFNRAAAIRRSQR